MEETRLLYELEKIFGKGKRASHSKAEYLFKCPCCDHHKKKLAINLESLKYRCWVCDLRGTDIISFIDYKYSLKIEIPTNDIFSQESFYNKVNHLVPRNPDIGSQFISGGLSLPEGTINFCDLNTPNYITYSSFITYLKRRNVCNEDINKLNVGFNPEQKRIIFPSYDLFGELNYFTGRSIYDLSPKYLNPTIDKDNIIFNEKFIDFDTKHVFLVEGIFDYLKTNYLDHNVILTLGSSLSKKSKIFQYILNFKEIFLMYDRDAIRKMNYIAECFSGYGKEVFILDWKQSRLSGLNDLGDSKTKFNIPIMDYNLFSNRYRLSYKV